MCNRIGLIAISIMQTHQSMVRCRVRERKHHTRSNKCITTQFFHAFVILLGVLPDSKTTTTNGRVVFRGFHPANHLFTGTTSYIPRRRRRLNKPNRAPEQLTTYAYETPFPQLSTLIHQPVFNFSFPVFNLLRYCFHSLCFFSFSFSHLFHLLCGSSKSI